MRKEGYETTLTPNCELFPTAFSFLVWAAPFLYPIQYHTSHQAPR